MKIRKVTKSVFDEPSSPNCFLWQTSGFSGKPLNFYSTDSPTRYPNEGGVYKVIAKSVSRFSKDVLFVCKDT